MLRFIQPIRFTLFLKVQTDIMLEQYVLAKLYLDLITKQAGVNTDYLKGAFNNHKSKEKNLHHYKKTTNRQNVNIMSFGFLELSLSVEKFRVDWQKLLIWPFSSLDVISWSYISRNRSFVKFKFDLINLLISETYKTRLNEMSIGQK